MKKILALGIAALMLLSLAACSNNGTGADYGGDSTPPSTSASAESKAPANNATTGKINVISREDGSGTRGAFIELFGVEEKDADGKKIDKTTVKAEVTNSTSVMMTSVAGDKNAIGYISLGSLNDTVKAASIDGTAPSVAAIKDGSYAISRPFNIVTKGELSAVAQDFADFIMSTEGQDVIEHKGYIRMEDTGAFKGGLVGGKVIVAGSSSVTPAMEALAEAYMALNGSAQIEIQQSDSTTGVNSTIDGICDIGMASRELKDSEIEKGVQALVIALDGIAVIVNNSSSVSDLSKEQVRQIFTGEISDWSQLG